MISTRSCVFFLQIKGTKRTKWPEDRLIKWPLTVTPYNVAQHVSSVHHQGPAEPPVCRHPGANSYRELPFSPSRSVHVCHFIVYRSGTGNVVKLILRVNAWVKMHFSKTSEWAANSGSLSFTEPPPLEPSVWKHRRNKTSKSKLAWIIHTFITWRTGRQTSFTRDLRLLWEPAMFHLFLGNN